MNSEITYFTFLNFRMTCNMKSHHILYAQQSLLIFSEFFSNNKVFDFPSWIEFNRVENTHKQTHGSRTIQKSLFTLHFTSVTKENCSKSCVFSYCSEPNMRSWKIKTDKSVASVFEKNLNEKKRLGSQTWRLSIHFESWTFWELMSRSRNYNGSIHGKVNLKKLAFTCYFRYLKKSTKTWDLEK